MTIAATASRGAGSSSTENRLPEPVKSRLPDRMVGMLGEGRVQHLPHRRLAFEPARQLERPRLVLLHPDRQRPQPARREEGIVGRGADAQRADASR